MKKENIQLNRKMLSELAMNEPYSFKALVDQVKFMRGSTPVAATIRSSSSSSSQEAAPKLAAATATAAAGR